MARGRAMHLDVRMARLLSQLVTVHGAEENNSPMHFFRLWYPKRQRRRREADHQAIDRSLKRFRKRG